MPVNDSPLLLLGSHEPALVAAVEPVLVTAGNRVKLALSADAALEATTATDAPKLALLDAVLPGMPLGQLLAAVRVEFSGARLPIVLISDTITYAWTDYLREGLIQDVIPRSAAPAYWRLRVEQVLRHTQMTHELSALHEAAVLDAQRDRLTGVYNREALLTMLFRETDRAQRMDSPLCLVLFDVDDFGHWNFGLGAAACDELLHQVAVRTGRWLRSYDLLGRMSKDKFLVVLPGCSPENAIMLVERLRSEVFDGRFCVNTDSIRLSSCFGVAVSRGRSPVVVLREAERALANAREAGPEMIQCFGEGRDRGT